MIDANLTDPSLTLVEEAETFVSIPDWVLLHPQLSAPAVRLYGVLKKYARKSERAWPGRKTLAGHLGCSEDSIDRYVKQLRDVGAVRTTSRWTSTERPATGPMPIFLEPGPGRMQTSSVYQLAWHEPKVVNGSGLAAAQVQGGGRTDAGTGGRTSAGTVAAPVRPEVHAGEAHAVEEPTTGAAAPAAKERDTQVSREHWRRADELKLDRNAIARSLVADFFELHRGETAQAFPAVYGVIKTALANGLAPSRLFEAMERVHAEGRPISGGTLQTALRKVPAPPRDPRWPEGW